MQRAYNADGDKKSRLDAQNQKIESDKTIQLLTTALKRYKNLHVIEVAEEEETGGRHDSTHPDLALICSHVHLVQTPPSRKVTAKATSANRSPALST